MAPRDFPYWLPPMLVKELRQGLRTRGFAVTFVAGQLVLVTALLILIGVNPPDLPSSQRMLAGWMDALFWGATGITLIFATPLRAMGSLAAERDQRSLDLLVLTRLTPGRIVLGKWFSLQMQAWLVIVALLPWGVVRYFFGTLDVAVDVPVLCLQLAGGATLTALAIWVSTQAKAFRILMPIALVLSLQAGGGVLVAVTAGPGRMAFGGGSPLSLEGVAFGLVNATFATVALLHAATSRVAPVARNHAVVPRLLVWVWLLVGAGWAATRSPFGAATLVVACSALTLAAIAGLNDRGEVRAVHARPWLRRGKVSQWFGRLLLPGHASALVWLLATLVVVAGALVAVRYAADHPVLMNVVRLTPAFAAALVFPAAVARSLGFLHTRPIAAFVALVVMFSLPAIVLSAMPGSFNDLDDSWVARLAAIVPISGLWLGMKLGMPWFVAAVRDLVVLAVILWSARQARGEWRMFEVWRVNERRARAAAAEAAAATPAGTTHA